jgi:sentrin-specific protease 7
MNIMAFLFCSGPKPSRTGDVPAKEAACGGQKQGDDGGVTPEMAAPHPKGS